MSREIKVTALVQFIYPVGGEDDLIKTPQEAVEDVQSMLANGELSSSDFTVGWTEKKE